jgi:hypothetical protein
LTFRQAARTVMDTKEPLLRTDWAIYRGGAIFFNGAEDCALEDSFLDQVGGNAIFVNNYNRRVTIRGTKSPRPARAGFVLSATRRRRAVRCSTTIRRTSSKTLTARPARRAIIIRRTASWMIA